MYIHFHVWMITLSDKVWPKISVYPSSTKDALFIHPVFQHSNFLGCNYLIVAISYDNLLALLTIYVLFVSLFDLIVLLVVAFDDISMLSGSRHTLGNTLHVFIFASRLQRHLLKILCAW